MVQLAFKPEVEASLANDHPCALRSHAPHVESVVSEDGVDTTLEDELDAALADKDVGRAVRAIRKASTQRGMSSVSRHTGLNRENLYRMLGEDGNPKLETLLRLLDIHGLGLAVRRLDDRPL